MVCSAAHQKSATLRDGAETRRGFITAALTTGLFSSSPAVAALACTAFDRNGVQQCTAGIETRAIQPALQECPSWCWAACIQSIFRLHGRNVSQRSIVQRLFGSEVCNTADGPQIVQTVNGTWRDVQGNRFSATAAPLLDLSFGITNPEASRMVAQELAAGNPLINGALGHATVLTAMTYLVDIYSRGRPLEIIVRDPWPQNQNRRRLTAAEAQGTFFIARVSIG